MSDNHNYCVIIAGGWGTRFWPVSRSYLPKQFLDLDGSGCSLLRQTWDRMRRIIPEDHILVASLVRYEKLVREQIPELKGRNLLLEPYNRNTAPCIAYAACKLLRRDPDAVMVAAPADHIIKGNDAFDKAVMNALAFAASGDVLVATGIVPTRPDPNFGYIQVSGTIEGQKPVRIKTFTEKPDKELAEVFCNTGEFLWNSGIYVWKAGVVDRELERWVPEIHGLWQGWENFIDTPDEPAALERIYSSIPRLSIDYAVMEHTDAAWVCPANFDWADLGNWDSLHTALSAGDADSNAIRVKGRTLLKDCKDNIIISNNPGKLIVASGLENFVIVDSGDALMICPRDDARLKDIVSELAMPGYEQYK